MKVFFRLFVMILLTALLAGCFSVSTTVNLKKDGSGTLEEKILVRPMNLFGQQQKQPNTMFNEAELREKATDYGKGVTFVSGKAITEDGMNGYIAVYAFEDINKIQMDQNMAGKAVDLPSMGPAVQENMQEYVTFEFVSGSTSTLKITYPEPIDQSDMEEDMTPEPEEMEMEIDDEMMEMMKEIYNGMKFSVKFNFDGDIKETNATHQEGNSIVLMDVDFGKLTEDLEMMKKLSRAQEMSQQEVQELLKNVEGMKVESNRSVEVKFK